MVIWPCLCRISSPHSRHDSCRRLLMEVLGKRSINSAPFIHPAKAASKSRRAPAFRLDRVASKPCAEIRGFSCHQLPRNKLCRRHQFKAPLQKCGGLRRVLAIARSHVCQHIAGIFVDRSISDGAHYFQPGLFLCSWANASSLLTRERCSRDPAPRSSNRSA